MKKIFSFVIACILITTIATPLNAEVDELSQRRIENAPNYQDIERSEEVNRQNAKIEKYINSKKSKTVTPQSDISIMSGGSKKLSVKIYEQEESYYCGPASAQMVLKYVTGTKYSQSSLASLMGTTSNGTYVYKLTNALNSKIGRDDYQYVGTWESSFSSDLLYSIDNDHPMISHVDTKKLPVYNKKSYNHYVVDVGYYWYAQGGNGASDVTYNDPHYNSSYGGQRKCTFSQMEDAIDANAGFYIRYAN